jgi:hypothetical protein
VALGQVFSEENFGFPLPNPHSICFSTIIFFTINRGWHNRPGVAANANKPHKPEFKKKKNTLISLAYQTLAKSATLILLMT